MRSQGLNREDGTEIPDLHSMIIRARGKDIWGLRELHSTGILTVWFVWLGLGGWSLVPKTDVPILMRGDNGLEPPVDRTSHRISSVDNRGLFQTFYIYYLDCMICTPSVDFTVGEPKQWENLTVVNLGTGCLGEDMMIQLSFLQSILRDLNGTIFTAELSLISVGIFQIVRFWLPPAEQNIPSIRGETPIE